jgi:PPOX class probable F420-dependent enzyme
MTIPLDTRARQLIDGRNLAVLTTLDAGGAPQSSVVFVGRDGDTVLFSTITGRAKTRNMRRDPRVSLLVLDSTDGHWVQVRGRVEITPDPGKALLAAMYDKYLGTAPPAEDAQRLVVRVVPERVVAFPPAA